MKIFLFLLCLILTQSLLAAPMCSEVFLNGSRESKKSNIQELEEQLAKHFKSEWIKDRDLTDASAAKQLLKKLSKHGTDADLEFLKVYLQIIESTKGNYFVRTPGFYVDMRMGQRPKSSHFQDRHWDWNILEGYFFNSPSLMTFAKEADLQYLNHVLKTAKEQATPKTLKHVLLEANKTWALQSLQSHPALLQEFSSYVGNKNYATLYKDLEAKFAKLSGNNSFRNSLDAFRSGNSSFDLFIFDKYMDLVLQFPKSEWKAPSWLQLTDWRVFEMGLSTGSANYVTDFLFQNSHDIASKVYLLRILKQLEAPSFKREDDFYFSFLKARSALDKKIGVKKAPAIYQTDIRIFSVSHEPTESVPGHLNEVQVFWNETLGRIQANVVRSTKVDLKKEMTVGMNPQLRAYVKRYFDGFRESGTYSTEEIKHFESKEYNSPLLPTTYISFTKPHTDKMVAMIRIFDATNVKTFIERDFNVTFPERRNREPIYELGRLIATPEVESKAFPYIMARVAEYFKNTNSSGMTYGDGNSWASTYYQKFGYKIVYTPEQLKIPSDATPMWIFRQSVADVIQRFYKPLETVKLRTPEKSAN